LRPVFAQAPTALSPTATSTVLASVQTFINKTPTWASDFTKEDTLKAGNQKTHRAGHLYFAQPSTIS